MKGRERGRKMDEEKSVKEFLEKILPLQERDIRRSGYSSHSRFCPVWMWSRPRLQQALWMVKGRGKDMYPQRYSEVTKSTPEPT
jgi:hypothetical protein